jgi:hypothetical protein
MKTIHLCALVLPAVALLVSAACGDEEATVRGRLDAGPEASASSDADSASACGVTPPSTYESPTFETNAAQELGIRKAFDDFLAPMRTVETQIVDGGTPTAITKAQLDALYGAGTPSVKATTTPYFQAKVEAWLQAYETAVANGTYSPDAPDGGGTGGRLGGYIFDPTGLDLHQAIESGTYSAAFYADGVSVIGTGSITTGTIDRLVAAFGAHPSFPNNPEAPQNRDVNAAAHAAQRDSKDVANPGPYQRIRGALIKAKAYVEAGERCKAERDAALQIVLHEWEKSNYATVIYDLNDITARLIATTSDYAPLLHEFGEAVGLISGFKTIAPDKRIITDAQIDSLLQRVLAPDGGPVEAYKLKANPVDVVSRFGQAITDIKGIYSFSDAEVEAFKKKY